MKQLRCSLGLSCRPSDIHIEWIFQEELQRIQRSLDAQSEQLRAALASAKPDSNEKHSPERTPDDPSAQANSSETGLENTLKKLDLANQEISRLKQMLQEWKKYGNEWKHDSQIARARASDLQRREDELSAKVKAAEESKVLLDTEIQGLTNALANQTVCSPYFLRIATIPIFCLLGSGGAPTYCLSRICETSSGTRGHG